MEERPDPETLLKRVQEEERKEKRGKLKIYLGAAPGVGKTYTMLNDALAKRAQGLDVVVGIVETHGRREIEFLIEDLESLPMQLLDYRGKRLSEFDLDSALRRNPGLILIDEMAHTNIPGLRHAKRWQDIKELLDRGIDVYTTLNVQHIESLNDIVAQIIHSRVKETVPDSLIEMADTIELVDLPPEELLKRLHEGKVYLPAQAEIAADHFFRKGNLTALRELALRVTAERVGAQVLLYRQGQGIRHIWPTKKKILVCVGSRAGSTKLIRAARRMAASLQAEWIAVHVETPRLQLSEEERNIAIQNLRLAELLGAQTRIIAGFDVVKEILNFAHEQNITMIMLWKRIRSRLRDFVFGSLADELVRNSGEIDVYILTGDSDAVSTEKPTMVARKPAIPWKTYAVSIFIVTLATLINLVIYPYVTHPSDLIMVYLVGVTVVALFGRTGPSILASLLSVIAYEFFFVHPFYSVISTNVQDIFSLLVMLLVAQIISHLTILTRRQADASRLMEQHTASLHSLSRQLASTRGVDKLLNTASRYIGEMFDSQVWSLLPESGRLMVRAAFRAEEILSPKEQAVAQWVYDLGQSAGLGTDTLPYSDAVYVPLMTSQGPIGVIRVRPQQSGQLFTPEQMHLLEAGANQVAVAIEVDRIQEQAKKAELQSETDRARNALLQAVSHDLRAPLVAITAAAATLADMRGGLDANKVVKLGNKIYLEAEQLNRLINNLLQLIYLEAESVKLQKEPGSLAEVIQHVLEISSKKLGAKLVNIQIAPDLPDVPFDKTLIQEVLLNLIDNAIKFTTPDSPIDITAKVSDGNVLVSIEDRGPGIMPDEVDKLFEKFYRGRMLTSERGLGLGLAICHSVIKAHGGKIWAVNRTGGGASFCFTLPLHDKA